MNCGTPLLRNRPSARRWQIGVAAWFMGLILIPEKVYAYIDPGAAGMLSQLLYVLFYGALGVFLYMLRYFKSIANKIKGWILMPKNSSSNTRHL